MNHQRRIFRSQKFNGNLVVVSDIFYFHPEPWGIFAPIVTFAALFFRWVGEKPPPMDQYGGFFFSLRWVWRKYHHTTMMKVSAPVYPNGFQSRQS